MTADRVDRAAVNVFALRPGSNIASQPTNVTDRHECTEAGRPSSDVGSDLLSWARPLIT